jgi:RND family efflux transporter MFP subunit
MENEKQTTQPDKDVRNGLSRFRRWVPALLVVFLLVVIGILFARIHIKAEIIKEQNQAGMKKERPLPNVVTLELKPTMLRDVIDLPGITRPWVALNLTAEVAGTVTAKKVKEGTAVQQGDILATIDYRDYKNAHQSAKAAYELAVSDLDRLQKLYQRKVTPQSQLDAAVAQVASTKAAYRNATTALERCVIRAPFSGMVNQVFVEQGQYLAVGDPVTEMLKLDRLKVRVGIPESDVDAVRRVDVFKVRIDAVGGRTFEARKYFLSKTADSMARLYNLDLELDNSDETILPDMFARVEIVKQEIPEGLSIPLYSVINRNDDHIVFTVDGDQARAKSVVLGLLDGWQVQVSEGLMPGEQVIVVGHRSVNDGERVNIVRKVSSPEEIIQ